MIILRKALNSLKRGGRDLIAAARRKKEAGGEARVFRVLGILLFPFRVSFCNFIPSFSLKGKKLKRDGRDNGGSEEGELE